MPDDIRSTIRIEDGFSEPLKNLAKEAWDAKTAVTGLGSAVMELSSTLDKDKAIKQAIRYAGGRAAKQVMSILTKNAAVVSNIAKQRAVQIRNETKLIAEKAKLFKQNLPFEINEAKIALYNTKNILQNQDFLLTFLT